MMQEPIIYSKEIEMMILGIAMTRPRAISLIIQKVQAKDFFFSEHQIIFDSMVKTCVEGTSCDIQIVMEELKRQNRLKDVGNASCLINLAQYAGTAGDLEAYIKDLLEYSRKRQLLEFFEVAKFKISRNESSLTLTNEFKEKIRQIEKSGHLKTRLSIFFISQRGNNYFTDTPPKKKMLLECIDDSGKIAGFLPSGIVAMLVGSGGVGKTHLLAQLAISISLGTSWLETYIPLEGGFVFFGLGENDEEDIRRVLFKAFKKYRSEPVDSNDCNFLNVSDRLAPFSFCGQPSAFIEKGKPTSFFYELKENLIKSAPPSGWNLIILDPVSRFLGADAENDNAAATQFIALLEELIKDLPGNPTILFAHHKNKTSVHSGVIDQTAARGSSALTDGVRWQIDLSRSEGNLVLKLTKSNFTQLFKELRLKQDNEGYIEQTFESPKPEEVFRNKPKSSSCRKSKQQPAYM